MCDADMIRSGENAVEKQEFFAIVGWLGLTGSVRSKLGHKWVKSGSAKDHAGPPDHACGLMGHVGSWGHMGPRAIRFW